MSSGAHDLITMGRVSVDIYPDDIGVPLPQVRTFSKFLGGSATNVAVATARYGHRGAVVTRTGADPFGEYIHQALRGFGVDDSYVTPVEHLPTPVVFCEIFPPDDFPLYFYRFPKAPDLEIHEHELDLDAIRAARIFWVTGTGLCDEPSRTSTLSALRARGHGAHTVIDLDYRPMFWPDEATAREVIGGAVEHATVAVGNLDECEIAVGTRDPERAAQELLDRGVELAIVKQGPKGVLARTRDDRAAEGAGGGGSRRGLGVLVPPVPVEVVNGLGAGDAFGGALCHGLLSGWDIERTMRYANAAGAYVAGQLACADAMPDQATVEQLLAEQDGGSA